MRDIVFHEVGMENFGPYVEPMVLTFENDKLTLITGPNGIGKTMSLEALPFTLFGETCKKAKGDDVVNTRTGRNCHTWVKFSINADNYQVDRYHKYTKLNNTVTISKNGEEPYKKGHREVLPEVEKLICSKKSFTNTLMFGQKVKDFFTDLIDSDKKEIFRKILDLDIYTQWYKEADLDLKAIKERIQKVVEQIGINHGIIEDNKQQIAIIAEQHKQFEADRKSRIDEHKKSLEESQRLLNKWEEDQSKLPDVEQDAKDIIEKLQNVQRQLVHHETEKEKQILMLYKGRDAKLAETSEAASTAKAEINKEFRGRYDELSKAHMKQLELIAAEKTELDKQLSDLTSDYKSFETEQRMLQINIDKLNDSLELPAGACPTCLREIDDQCREHLEKESLKYVHEHTDIENKKKVLHDSTSKVQENISKNSIKYQMQTESFQLMQSELENEEEAKLKEVDDKLNGITSKIHALATSESVKITNDYDEYISNLQAKITEMTNMKEVIMDTHEKKTEIDHSIANLQQSIKGIEFKLKFAEDEEYDMSQLKAHKLRYAELQKMVKDSEVELVKLQTDEAVSTFWKTAWSPTGIPSMLIDESIPFMNEKVSEYLDRLTNGRYIVSFDTLAATKAGEFRDKISVNVLDTYTRANSRIQLSGGQTRLVDIATILTLGDLQASIQDVNINILLFDEIFDSLDEENIGFVSKILSQLKIGKSIYLISHTQVEQLEADEVLEFK
jgi:DNA repair exonuclease SbcCD ATPase subunit